MEFSRGFRIFLRVCMWIGLAILYIPLILIVVNSFNQSKTFSFPPTGFTLQWWIAASHSTGALHALGTSVIAGVGATVVALLRGPMAGVAVRRYRFFGRPATRFRGRLPAPFPSSRTTIDRLRRNATPTPRTRSHAMPQPMPTGIALIWPSGPQPVAAVAIIPPTATTHGTDRSI